MRVALAHESAGVIAALRQVISAIKGWRITWVETDGETAVSRCAQDTPDLLLLSPGVTGPDVATMTRRIMRISPCVIVIVARDPQIQAGAVFEAMSAGAVDAMTAPAVGSDGLLIGLEDATRRLKTAAMLVSPRPESAPSAGAISTPPTTPLVVIGASTGGPAVVASVLSALPASFDAAVVVVQHVDARFAPNLVAWLRGHTSLAVVIAAAGARPMPGAVAVTGANDDLVLTPSFEFSYRQPRDGTFYHPSVDVFFESTAAYWPSPGVAVLLTGIGRDGAGGLLALRRKGWHTIAQDERSSVVYGMPRAAAEINAAVEILPTAAIGPAIVRALHRRAAARRGTRG